jgi:hypothetical protein
VFKIVTSSERLLRMTSQSRVLSRVIFGDLRLLPVTRSPGLADHIVSEVWVDRVALSKQTAAGRFGDLDRMLLDLTRHVPTPTIHDVGVSSGITSLELLDRFRARGLALRLYISDKFARCTCVRRGPVTSLHDAYGGLLQGRVGPLMADPKASWYFPFSRILSVLLQKASHRGRSQNVTEFLLYDGRVMRALDAGAMTHLDYDLFSSRLDVRFDVVRCMNVITTKYFSAERIAAALTNLGHSLKPSALLLVGRTLPDGHNEATFFRLSDDGCFVPERVVNGGADIHEIVTRLDMRVHAHRPRSAGGAGSPPYRT